MTRLAERTAEAMYARDRASQGLGMTIEEVRPGYARLRMTVRPDMLNGHDICHGGVGFAVADPGPPFARNSPHPAPVAAGAAIEFLAAVRAGEVLVAEAVEQSLGGRLGVYDVGVRNGDGVRVALFRGRSYAIKGSVIAEAGP